MKPFDSGKLTTLERIYFNKENVRNWVKLENDKFSITLSEIPQPYQSLLDYHLPGVLRAAFGLRSVDDFAEYISDWCLQNLPSFPGVLKPKVVPQGEELKPLPTQEPHCDPESRFSYLEVD